MFDLVGAVLNHGDAGLGGGGQRQPAGLAHRHGRAGVVLEQDPFHHHDFRREPGKELAQLDAAVAPASPPADWKREWSGPRTPRPRAGPPGPGSRRHSHSAIGPDLSLARTLVRQFTTGRGVTGGCPGGRRYPCSTSTSSITESGMSKLDHTFCTSSWSSSRSMRRRTLRASFSLSMATVWEGCMASSAEVVVHPLAFRALAPRPVPWAG